MSWRHSSRLPIMHPIAIAVSTPYLHTKHRNRLHISSLTKHRKISLYWQGVDKLLPRSLGSRDAVQAGTEVGAAFCDYLLLFCKNRLFPLFFLNFLSSSSWPGWKGPLTLGTWGGRGPSCCLRSVPSRSPGVIPATKLSPDVVMGEVLTHIKAILPTTLTACFSRGNWNAWSILVGQSTEELCSPNKPTPPPKTDFATLFSPYWDRLRTDQCCRALVGEQATGPTNPGSPAPEC